MNKKEIRRNYSTHFFSLLFRPFRRLSDGREKQNESSEISYFNLFRQTCPCSFAPRHSSPRSSAADVTGRRRDFSEMRSASSRHPIKKSRISLLGRFKTG